MQNTHDLIDIGHTKVAHTQTGAGPDLMFIHGWPLHGDTWRNIVPALDGYTCHVIDLPGAGKSAATADTPLTFDGHVQSVISILDHLELENCTLVGHDSGGMIARLAAQQRPDVVDALVLAGTEIPGHKAWQVVLFSLLAKMPGAGNVLEMLVGNDVLARSPLVLGGCFSDLDHIQGDFAEIIGVLFADDALMANALTMVRNFDHDLVDSLSSVHADLRMPTLLIWGEDDPFFPVDKARVMAGQFGGETRFEVIADAKLFVHEEHPTRFAAVTRDFLEKVVSA